MKTLFELASFYSDNASRQGALISPQRALHLAATKAVEGYTDCREAEEETGTRYDGFGNEIEPSVVWEAVQYERAQGQWIQDQLSAVAQRIQEKGAAKIDAMPESEHFDKLVERIEREANEKCDTIERVSEIVAKHFETP